MDRSGSPAGSPPQIMVRKCADTRAMLGEVLPRDCCSKNWDYKRGLSPQPIFRKSKRIASAKRAGYKKQQSQYDTIVNVQIQATKRTDAYIAAFGLYPRDSPVMNPYASEG